MEKEHKLEVDKIIGVQLNIRNEKAKIVRGTTGLNGEELIGWYLDEANIVVVRKGAVWD